MPSTDHPIPKDVPLPSIFKPPDPDSNVFQPMSFLQINNLPSTINLQRRVFPDFAIFWCHTNFRLRQIPKDPDHLIGNRFWPVPNLPSTINLQQQVFPDFDVSCQRNFRLRQLPKEPDHLSKLIKFKKSEIGFSLSPKTNLYLRAIGSV